jgi:hypothetical protein
LAFAALAGDVQGAPARVELLGGGRRGSVRAGLGGGTEPAGIVAEWRAEPSGRAWRARGGARVERAGRTGASLEVETASERGRPESRVLLGASTRRGVVGARVDARASSRGSIRWRAELELPWERGTLDLVADVSAGAVDALELRATSRRVRARLVLPAAGATRAAVTLADLRAGGVRVRGAVAWERGGTTSIEAGCSWGDGR